MTEIAEKQFQIFLVSKPVEEQQTSKAIEQTINNPEFPAKGVKIRSPWAQQGDRVWSAIFSGQLQDNEAIYNLRRKVQLREPKSQIDTVFLPFDQWSSKPAKPSGTTASTTSTTSSNTTKVNGTSHPPRQRRQIKLAVFDMDSTLIQQEVIDELARSIGKYSEVAAITERAMRGELDFAGSLRERVALLRGLPSPGVWDQVKARISFSPGARALCTELKQLGADLAVLSGGFTPLADWIKDQLGLDVARANFLESEAANDEFAFEHLNGRLVEGKAIVTAEEKRRLLLSLAEERGVELCDVLCVGDGANDLKMLDVVGEAGGIAIAMNAKPKVQEAAPNKLTQDSLADILYLLGYSQKDHEALDAQSPLYRQ